MGLMSRGFVLGRGEGVIRECLRVLGVCGRKKGAVHWRLFFLSGEEVSEEIVLCVCVGGGAGIADLLVGDVYVLGGVWG